VGKHTFAQNPSRSLFSPVTSETAARSLRWDHPVVMIVKLTPGTERKLRELAQQRGLDAEHMVRGWIERELSNWVIVPSRLTDPEPDEST